MHAYNLHPNPASRFFGKEKVFAGRSVGVGDIYDQEIDPVYREIDNFLHGVPNMSPEAISAFLESQDISYLFVVVNNEAENQNTWLIPQKATLESESPDIPVAIDPKESQIIKGLLQAPHEKIIDSEVILYRFTYQ